MITERWNKFTQWHVNSNLFRTNDRRRCSCSRRSPARWTSERHGRARHSSHMDVTRAGAEVGFYLMQATRLLPSVSVVIASVYLVDHCVRRKGLESFQRESWTNWFEVRLGFTWMGMCYVVAVVAWENGILDLSNNTDCRASKYSSNFDCRLMILVLVMGLFPVTSFKVG